MMRFRFLHAAAEELESAASFYEGKFRQLSLDLRDEVERVLVFLVEFPEAAKPIDEVYRSCKLRRFPYLLIYRIEGDEIVIVAVAHAAREQGYWRERIDDRDG